MLLGCICSFILVVLLAFGVMCLRWVCCLVGLLCLELVFGFAFSDLLLFDVVISGFYFVLVWCLLVCLILANFWFACGFWCGLVVGG